MLFESFRVEGLEYRDSIRSLGMYIRGVYKFLRCLVVWELWGLIQYESSVGCRTEGC